LSKLLSRCPPWARAALGHAQAPSIAGVLALVAVAVVLVTHEERPPKRSVGDDAEISSQSKRT